MQEPVGFWDPAGLTADDSRENFQRRRWTELGRGGGNRLATRGCIAPESICGLPGCSPPPAGPKIADIPHGLGAISRVSAAGWTQIVAYGAFCGVAQDQPPGTAAAAGDFGFRELIPTDPAGIQERFAAEFASGRLAAMADS